MQNLPKNISDKVTEWRDGGYACPDFPLIGDILRFQRDGEAGGSLRFLRTAQFRALETYWYLRLVCNTPHIMYMYEQLYPDYFDFADVLGIDLSREEIREFTKTGSKGIIAKLKDPEWATKKKLDALHEAASLEYSGYIFALAMGAGKTVLIGTIIATEFAMAMQYDGGHNGVRFMQNALVFAPGKTIIESLREIAEIPMEEILPGQVLRDYESSANVIFPQDGQKDISVIKGGLYNIIVSNTEKISLRADVGNANQMKISKISQKKIIANARLQKIISLPNLGVFSDEAHHTYGNTVTDDIKRVRETINYIHEKTPLVSVVNTTGTPYHKKHILPDVVFWYGLREGIRDNILKGLGDGVMSYNLTPGSEDSVIEQIVKDFFKRYRDVCLPNGAPAKIAFYFKQQEHLDESRSHIESALTKEDVPLTCILTNTQQSSREELDDFNRLNDPTNQKRVILLVQKGTEGWNCPSLFACALIKEQTNDIFVLQAATRCLRQVPGNTLDATVYLSYQNKEKLDNGLKANFGHDISAISRQNIEEQKHEVVIQLSDSLPPPVNIVREVRHVVAKSKQKVDIKLTKITKSEKNRITVEIGSLNFDGDEILHFDNTKTINLKKAVVDCYLVAVHIASNYHLEAAPILRQLQSLYPKGKIPQEDIAALMRQIEQQCFDYEERVEKVRETLALIREFDDEGNPIFSTDSQGRRFYTLKFSESEFAGLLKHHRIVSNKQHHEVGKDEDDEPLFAHHIKDVHGLSYHYTPYCFDSKPEQEFFGRILRTLGKDPDDIRTFSFTGLANPRMNGFWFYYKGEDGAYHQYFPDFLLLKNSGEFLVVEVKSERERKSPDVQAKAKAVTELTRMPENSFDYVIIYANGAQMENEQGMRTVRKWIEGKTKKESHREQKEN